ncbi:hypothetical protein E2C01_024260 [Portunus trituberculatus]|uniref:Uncharacterized protein n=1 Tax=Portunus trituberculatus TaxID=210409 RepID=A0A5B7EBT0_PORTR|nr:hypothetical protein [Portunus trituberculatus]
MLYCCHRSPPKASLTNTFSSSFISRLPFLLFPEEDFFHVSAAKANGRNTSINLISFSKIPPTHHQAPISAHHHKKRHPSHQHHKHPYQATTTRKGTHLIISSYNQGKEEDRCTLPPPRPQVTHLVGAGNPTPRRNILTRETQAGGRGT